MKETIKLLSLFLAIGITLLPSCTFEKEGCTDLKASNYDINATNEDGSCIYTDAEVLGCTNPVADNYSPLANTDDGSCIFTGCIDPLASNYNPFANTDDGSCVVPGCMDPSAINYMSNATIDDGSCDFDWRPAYLGTWTSLNCSPDFLNIALTQIVVGGAANEVTFSPFFSDFSNRNASIDGPNINFASQSYFLTGSFTGSGTLSVLPDTTIEITFSYEQAPLINRSCTVTYAKQ